MYKLNISDIQEYAGQPYIELNGKEPSSAESELTTVPFEYYSPLDRLGRCGQAYANVCKEVMPTGERGQVGMIKFTGWHLYYANSIQSDNICIYNGGHQATSRYIQITVL